MLQVILHLFREFFVTFIDPVTDFLAVFHELVCAVLIIIVVFHYLLSTGHDPRHESQPIGCRSCLQHEDKAILDEKVQVDVPLFEVHDDRDAEQQLHEKVRDWV